LCGLLLRDAAVRVDGDDRHGKENEGRRDKRPGEDPSSQTAAGEESAHAATSTGALLASVRLSSLDLLADSDQYVDLGLTEGEDPCESVTE